MTRLVLPFAIAALAMSLTFATPADAQRRERGRNSERSVTIQGGAFIHDFYGDDARPMVAIRANWGLARWLLSEFGTFYTQPKDIRGAVDVMGVDLALQAQLPHSILRPYVGLGAGIHVTLEGGGGDRFAESSTQAMAGLRLRLTRGIGLRGEMRYRIDDQQRSPSAADNVEMTGGISWSW
ncbi:MAG: outer membrane beta-barrel protein [Gemmatimonadaceae bacterium]